MAASVSAEQWDAVRESLRTTGERFTALVSSVPDAGTRATTRAGVTWSVADILAHVTAIAWIDTTLLGAAAPPFPMPGLAAGLEATTVDDVHGFNDQVLSHFTERDPSRNVGTLRHHIDLLLQASADRDPCETLPWLAGSQLPLAGLVAHMVNELLIHGHDVARVVKAPWTMSSRDAALFFELFYVGLASGESGRILDGGGRPRERPIAVEFHSDYTTPITLVLRRGRLTAQPLGPGADARVRFDPAILNLVMFGRISRLKAVMTRKLIVGGPRPWLLGPFLRTVRAPS